MDLHNVQDLWRAVLKCCRAGASNSRDPGSSTDISRAKASGGDSGVQISLRVRYLPKKKFEFSFKSGRFPNLEDRV